MIIIILVVYIYVMCQSCIPLRNVAAKVCGIKVLITYVRPLRKIAHYAGNADVYNRNTSEMLSITG